MNFSTLLERHPELALDRHRLSFDKEAASADVAKAYGQTGIVMLTSALPPALLEPAASGFRQYLQAKPPSAATSNASGS